MRLLRNNARLGLGALTVALSVLLVGVLVALVNGGPGSTSDLAAATLVQEPPPAAPIAGTPSSDPTTSEPPAAVAPPTTAAVAAPAPAAAAPPAAPTTTAAPAPPRPTAPAKAAAAPAAAALAPFRGMGTWVDVFDWSPTYASGGPVKLGPDAVDAMAAQGVQTLYIQTARADWKGQGDIVDPDVLAQWLAKAQAHRMHVVAWYLPFFTDVAADARRLAASSALPGVTGVGVDIEDTKHVSDPDERGRRLVALSQQVRQLLAGRPLSAITLPNVVTDVINTSYWPRFPWAELRGLYDVWQPMGYWTNRTEASGWRDAHRYTYENIVRLRASLGDPNAVVSMVGGIGDHTTAADVHGFLQATKETSCIGVSLYDWSTQKPETYAPMATARA